MLRPTFIAAAFIAVLILIVPEQAVAAKNPLVTQLAPTLRPAADGMQTILVRARTRPAATCRATVSVKKTRQLLASAKATRAGRVSWRWQILSSSPSGTWRIAVTCSKAGRKATAVRRVLVITRSKSSKGPIGDPQSLSMPDGEIAGVGGGECGPFNHPPLKQCTCLAWIKRRDVYDTSRARGVPAGGVRLRSGGHEYYVWDGGQWLVNAQRGGFPTGSTPIAGALVVWGVPNSASYGHVAYVERAESPTRVLVTECNYDWRGSCRTIWMNPQAKANLQGYVYGGLAGGGASPGGGSLSPPPPPTAPSGTQLAKPISGIARTPTGNGYWEVGQDGGVFARGDAGYYDSLPGRKVTPAQPVVGIAGTPSGGGYWMAGADGGVFVFGDAGYYDSLPGRRVTPVQPIVGFAPTPTGKGYRLAGADGGVFVFGDAGYYDSLPGRGVTPAEPIVGIANTSSGNGYRLAGADGGVFVFGDAGYHDSLPGRGVTPTKPIVGIANTPSGNGYWLAGADGGVFAFGDAGYYDSLPGRGIVPKDPVVGITATPSGNGYWLVAADGGVFAFGDAGFHGTP